VYAPAPVSRNSLSTPSASRSRRPSTSSPMTGSHFDGGTATDVCGLVADVARVAVDGVPAPPSGALSVGPSRRFDWRLGHRAARRRHLIGRAVAVHGRGHHDHDGGETCGPGRDLQRALLGSRASTLPYLRVSAPLSASGPSRRAPPTEPDAHEPRPVASDPESPTIGVSSLSTRCSRRAGSDVSVRPCEAPTVAAS
jgi:hypothetical protein